MHLFYIHRSGTSALPLQLQKLGCGPMPNVMAALPNIGGALCSTPQSLADARCARVPCSNAAKKRNPLKFAGVPQTPEPISAVSGPKFTILWGRVEDILLFNRFLSDYRYMSQMRRNSPTNCAMGSRWRFFASFLTPVFPASHVRHISDLHSKSALRPLNVWKYGRHPICHRWD